MTTDELHWLTSIADDPADQGRRLIFADWLEERGDPRAAAVRASNSATEVVALFLVPELKPVVVALADAVQAAVPIMRPAMQAVAGVVGALAGELRTMTSKPSPCPCADQGPGAG